MAVIVQQQQPNWLAQLAANVVVPMITSAIERHRERDNNRKENVMRGQVRSKINELIGANGGTADILPPLSSTLGGNGWENAFHNTDNSLGSFGEAVGLSNIASQAAQSLGLQGTGTASTPYTPTPADWRRIIDTIRADKRFSHLSPQAIDELFASDIQAAEAARVEANRRKAAEDFEKASDALGGYKSGLGAMIRGDLPESFANIVENYYSSTRPQPFTHDIGGGLVQGTYDPMTNAFSTQNTIEKTLSPQQVKDNEYRDALFGYTKENDAENRKLERYRIDTNASLQQQRITNDQTNADRDYELRRIQAMSDIQFKEYQMKETQKAAQAGDWSKDKEARIKFSTDELARIEKEEQDLRSQLESATRQDEIDKIQNRLEELKGLKNMHRTAVYNAFYPQQQPGYKSPGSLMLGSENNTFSEGQRYKAPRTKKDGTKYEHGGVDYGANADKNITLHSDLGSDFKVVRVNTDPNASGYGCFVEIEGTRNGKKVKYLMAHMQEGSISVKEGDAVNAGEVLGKVGSTGRSSGPHLHLEVREFDGSVWQRKNPEEYLSGETTQATATEDSQSNGQAPQDNGQTVEPDKQTATTTPQDMRPSYQTVNMPAAMTSPYSPLPAQPQPTRIAQQGKGSGLTGVHALEVGDTPELPEPISQDVQPTTAQQTPTPSAATSWNPFAATPAYADDLPLDAVSGASPDDGGLTQYRAEGDTSPVTWRNASGSPRLTSDRQLFTQKIYDEWATKADAGGFRDVGINNRVDLDKWLNSIGMSSYRPAEQRGLNNLNGRSNANLPPEGVDDGVMPFDSRPSTSPEKYPAPTFTDELNGTTPADTQDLLDGLNGITNSRYRNWTRALRQYYPSAAYTPEINVPERPNIPEAQHMPTGTPSSNGAIPTQARASSAAPTRTAPAPRRVAPTPRRAEPSPKRGYTNYAEQRNAVDTAAKNNGIDSRLIRAIIQVESGWKPTARSKSGAMGLMQLMPGTARELGVRNAYDPAQNIAGGSKYIARLIRRYGGDVSKALMAYNCGPGNVAKGRIPQASRQYAQKVMGIYNRLRAQG